MLVFGGVYTIEKTHVTTWDGQHTFYCKLLYAMYFKETNGSIFGWRNLF